MKYLTQLVLPALLVIGLICGAQSAHAAAGSLDPAFGRDGVTVTGFASSSFVIPFAIKLQADGKILVLVQAGFSKTQVLRYTSAGALDATFGNRGIATLPASFGLFGAMAVQSNGKIVVAGEVSAGKGEAAFGVERLNANGSADLNFGNGGLAMASMGFPGIQAVLLIQPNESILLGAQLGPNGRRQPFRTALARFTSVGVLDPTFGIGGTVAATAVGGCSALAVLSSGEILVVNADHIAQFSADGSVESTDRLGTIVASAGSESPSSVSAFQPNGDYIFAQPLNIGTGRAHNLAVQVQRFKASGDVDSAFANPTVRFVATASDGVEDVPNGVAIGADGNIVVVGQHSTKGASGSSVANGLVRLTPIGSFDSTFGEGGVVINAVPSGAQGINGVVIQPADGKIVTVGIANNETELAISRYLAQ